MLLRDTCVDNLIKVTMEEKIQVLKLFLLMQVWSTWITSILSTVYIFIIHTQLNYIMISSLSLFYLNYLLLIVCSLETHLCGLI